LDRCLTKSAYRIAEVTGDRTAVEQVVVTGGRGSARPNLQSNVPGDQVTAAQLQNTGAVSVGDVLNELPAIRSTFSSSNSTRFIGTAGLNFLDLRGLGTTGPWCWSMAAATSRRRKAPTRWTSTPSPRT
jgi:hypothetical protein